MQVILVDTEGILSVSAFNVAYLVVNLPSCEIIHTGNLVIFPNIWDNLVEITNGNNPEITPNLKKLLNHNIENICNNLGEYTIIKSRNGLATHFKNLFKKYPDISQFFAFNVSFDKQILSNSMGETVFNAIFGGLSFYDIQSMYFFTHCYNMEYVRFCYKNGFLTKKGNCSTTAETFYRYYLKNPKYSQKHLALDDIMSEYELFQSAITLDINCEKSPKKCWYYLDKLYDKNDSNLILEMLE